MSARLDEEMLPVAARDLDAHLVSCPECAQFAEDITALNRRVRVRPIEATPDLTTEILAAASVPDAAPEVDQPEPSRRVLAAAGVAGPTAASSMRRRTLVGVGAVAAILLVLGVWLAGSRTGPPADVQIAAGYVTVGAEGDTAQVYLDVTNDGGADAITGATTPVAEQTALHTTTVENDLVLMDGRGQIPVPANGSVAFRPGGAHVMLEGLRDPVAVGDQIPVTVELADSTAITVQARVVNPDDLAGVLGVEPAGS